MGIEKVELYTCKCDGCGEYYDNGDYQPVFGDELDVDNTVREDEWHRDGDKYYCRNCHEYDDDDNVVITIQQYLMKADQTCKNKSICKRLLPKRF